MLKSERCQFQFPSPSGTEMILADFPKEKHLSCQQLGHGCDQRAEACLEDTFRDRMPRVTCKDGDKKMLDSLGQGIRIPNLYVAQD